MNLLPPNTNLRIHNASTFQSLSIQNERNTLINEYLNKVNECFSAALKDYSRVCMIRFDLHVPSGCTPESLIDNRLIYRFFSSLKEKISYSQIKSIKLGNRVNHTEVRFIWCRESSSRGNVHYHVALLLNDAAYSFIGKFDLSSNNMYARINQAWGSALHAHTEDIQGLVHVPDNPVYHIQRDDAASLNEAFHRISYFCKAESKEFGNRHHCFGCSRI